MKNPCHGDNLCPYFLGQPSMASPKSTHQLKSLVLIPSIIRDKSFRLKVPIPITEFSIPLMLLAQINFFYHLPTLSFPPFILLLLKFLTVEFSISVTYLAILIVPSHLFASTPYRGPNSTINSPWRGAPQGSARPFYSHFTIVELKSKNHLLI